MFIIIQFLIYTAFLFLDITGRMAALSSLLKFISICLCYIAVDDKKAHIKKIMALTVAADFLLVITPFYTAGILIFIAVQLEYYKYITKKACFPLYHLASMVCAGFAVSIFVNFFIMAIDFNVFLSCIYFFTLINNIRLCMLRSGTSREYTLLTVCLILIMCCDIHVGVTNVFSSGLWYSFGLIAMWLFYLPSQVLIALLYSTNNQSRHYS